MIPAGESQSGSPVPQRPHHGYQTLQSDAHQQETLTRHQDVLQGVEDVGKHKHVELRPHTDTAVADEEDD